MDRLCRWLYLLTLLVSTPCLYAIEVGHVTEIDDKAELIRDGSVFALELGVAVSADDIVKTGDDSIAQLEMLDGSVLDVGPSSELHIAQYSLEENNQLNGGEVSLLAGWLRFITSKLNTSRTFNINTPTMSIGIRGTEGIIGIDEVSSQLELATGQVDVVGVDAEGNDFQVSRVIRAGEFIQHNLDGSAEHLPQSPESFRQRKHPRFKVALVRKLQKLAKRGVLPKKLRKANVDDLKRLLKTNPRIRERLFKHLEKSMMDPAFRSRLKNHLKDNPALQKKLRSSKTFQKAKRQYEKERRKVQQQKKSQEKKRKYNRDRDSGSRH
jgi:hypothetical protein